MGRWPLTLRRLRHGPLAIHPEETRLFRAVSGEPQGPFVLRRPRLFGGRLEGSKPVLSPVEACAEPGRSRPVLSRIEGLVTSTGSVPSLRAPKEGDRRRAFDTLRKA